MDSDREKCGHFALIIATLIEVVPETDCAPQQLT